MKELDIDQLRNAARLLPHYISEDNRHFLAFSNGRRNKLHLKEDDWFVWEDNQWNWIDSSKVPEDVRSNHKPDDDSDLKVLATAIREALEANQEALRRIAGLTRKTYKPRWELKQMPHEKVEDIAVEAISIARKALKKDE